MDVNFLLIPLHLSVLVTIDTMNGTTHQVSFSNNKHLVIGCQVCQPIRDEDIKTLLFSDWFTDLTTNHKVFVFRKRDLMFRTKHGIYF